MKIASVSHNNRKTLFEVRIRRQSLAFPYSKADPRPTRADPVVRTFVDEDIGREGFSYELASGRAGTIHSEQVLDYNQDPDLVRESVLYQLTLEARRRVARSPLAKRELVRRLGTSASQLYRLLDQTNYRKTVDQMIALLAVLDCEVDLVVRPRIAATRG